MWASVLHQSMPICFKCTKSFPNRVKIDGKVKNLSSRKFCLSCSPWGRHNTRDLLRSPMNGPETVCADCGRVYVYDRRAGHCRSRCNGCNVQRHRRALQTKAITHAGGRCRICGYNRCGEALHFHHIDPTTKSFAISMACAKTRSWKTVRDEVEKCVLLCGNCHAEVHAGLVQLEEHLVRTKEVASSSLAVGSIEETLSYRQKQPIRWKDVTFDESGFIRVRPNVVAL